MFTSFFFLFCFFFLLFLFFFLGGVATFCLAYTDKAGIDLNINFAAVHLGAEIKVFCSIEFNRVFKEIHFKPLQHKDKGIRHKEVRKTPGRQETRQTRIKPFSLT